MAKIARWYPIWRLDNDPCSLKTDKKLILKKDKVNSVITTDWIRFENGEKIKIFALKKNFSIAYSRSPLLTLQISLHITAYSISSWRAPLSSKSLIEVKRSQKNTIVRSMKFSVARRLPNLHWNSSNPFQYASENFAFCSAIFCNQSRILRESERVTENFFIVMSLEMDG
ncbi:Trehalase [Dirofilaria immitis]